MSKKHHEFAIEIDGDLHATLEQVRALITEYGGHFDGDAESGNIVGVTPVGTIRGFYVIIDRIAHITITDKPLIAPMKKIEAAVREFFD